MNINIQKCAYKVHVKVQIPPPPAGDEGTVTAKLELGGRCLLEVQWDRLAREESVTADQVDIIAKGGLLRLLNLLFISISPIIF